MIPTLHEGDRILVCRVCVRFDGVDRGDVIVFEGPDASSQDRGAVAAVLHWLGETLGVASPPHEDFVKRWPDCRATRSRSIAPGSSS